MTAKAWPRVASILLLALAGCAGEPPVDQGTISPSPAPPAAARRAPRIAGGAGRPFRAEITAHGVTVVPSRGRGWAFHATPSAFGCDGALAPPGDAAPVEREGRVEYARPALREWYVGGPRGLEQGFTLPAPPPCRRRGGRGVVIALGGGLGTVVSGGGRSARLHDASGTEVLRYTDLRAVDAAGRDLPARIEAAGQGLALRVDDTGATYPIEVDPMMWLEVEELTPPAGDVTLDNFGIAVALSGDTALVGAPAEAVAGRAYVFVRSGTSFSLQQEIVSTDTQPNASFGTALSLSGDTALIGAPDSVQGAAYVFVRSGAAWSQAQELDAPDPSDSDHFGSSVALSGDTAVVGAPGTEPSAAYVFVLSGGTWTLQQALGDGVSADAGVSDQLGTAVALSGDTAIVGAPTTGAGVGAAYVFVRSGTTWTLEQQLTAADGSQGDRFGLAVAIEGDTAVVGSSSMTTQLGEAYVFTRTGTAWTQVQALTDASVDGFGSALSLNGGTLVVGGDTFESPVTAAISVFAPSGGSLALEATLAPPSGTMDNHFGTSVAVDGTTVLAGAPFPASNQSAAYVFQLASADGDACTSPIDCFSGLCVDGVCCMVAACPAAGPCNAAETCQPGTGTCSVTPLHEGMPCEAGPCTSAATCQDGMCTGAVNVCAPADPCHEFGTCDPTSGTCSNPEMPDGQPCPGGACEGGVCVARQAEHAPAGGCGCEMGGSPPGGAFLAGVGLLLVARRRRGGRPGPRPSSLSGA